MARRLVRSGGRYVCGHQEELAGEGGLQRDRGVKAIAGEQAHGQDAGPGRRFQQSQGGRTRIDHGDAVNLRMFESKSGRDGGAQAAADGYDARQLGMAHAGDVVEGCGGVLVPVALGWPGPGTVAVATWIKGEDVGSQRCKARMSGSASASEPRTRHVEHGGWMRVCMEARGDCAEPTSRRDGMSGSMAPKRTSSNEGRAGRSAVHLTRGMEDELPLPLPEEQRQRAVDGERGRGQHQADGRAIQCGRSGDSAGAVDRQAGWRSRRERSGGACGSTEGQFVSGLERRATDTTDDRGAVATGKGIRHGPRARGAPEAAWRGHDRVGPEARSVRGHMGHSLSA